MAGRTARSRRWASVRAGRARRARQAGLSGRGAQGVLGRAGRQAHGRWRAHGRWQAGARAGERQLGAGAGRAAGRWARGRALGARQAGAGRAGRAQPGRLGWPWAVHSVHSAHFRSVLTRFFFPESPNEHCSL